MRAARVGISLGLAALVAAAALLPMLAEPTPAAAARQVVHKKPRELAPPQLGPALAEVVVERFCDYAQPQCASIDAVLTELAARHPDQLRVVFRTLPLRHIAASESLAQAICEAHAQGRFFAFRDAVYGARATERYSLELLATRAGLDVDAFVRALADGRHAAQVDADEAWAGRFGVEGVPALVWNGKRLALPRARLDDFERLYAAARAQAEARLRAGVPAPRLYTTLLRDELKARAAEVVRGQLGGGDADASAPRRVNVPVDGAPVRGGDDAAVRIVVFGDYQCSHCRALAHTLARLEEGYAGRVAIVWKHAPLEAHPDALLAARAAVCAQRQGKFWEFQARLYAQPYRVDREQLLEHASKLGLDVDRFADELDTGVCDARVAQDVADAHALGIYGQTPISFVNGIQLTGEQPLASLRAVIDDELEPGALARAVNP